MKSFVVSASLMMMVCTAHAGEPDKALEKGMSLYLNTQQAFSEAALCRAGSIVVGRVADARLRGSSRDEVEAGFGPNLPPALSAMIDAAYAYSPPGPENAETYYRTCTDAAIGRMNEATKKAVIAGGH